MNFYSDLLWHYAGSTKVGGVYSPQEASAGIRLTSQHQKSRPPDNAGQVKKKQWVMLAQHLSILRTQYLSFIHSFLDSQPSWRASYLITKQGLN